MPGRVEGKVALVMGGASGIGRATALTFAREGAKLVIADTNDEGGHQTVHMITENGGEAIFVKTDVSKVVEVQALISTAVATYGRLDCAHNNAGISGGGRALTAEYAEDTWHQVIAVNLTGVWLCMKYEIPQMLQPRGRGDCQYGFRGRADGWSRACGLCGEQTWGGRADENSSIGVCPPRDSGQLCLSRRDSDADDRTRLERSRTEGTHHCQ